MHGSSQINSKIPRYGQGQSEKPSDLYSTHYCQRRFSKYNVNVNNQYTIQELLLLKGANYQYLRWLFLSQ